jgi:hypothetical protein
VGHVSPRIVLNANSILSSGSFFPDIYMGPDLGFFLEDEETRNSIGLLVQDKFETP